jgi:hypothetical protein
VKPSTPLTQEQAERLRELYRKAASSLTLLPPEVLGHRESETRVPPESGPKFTGDLRP